MSDTEMQDLVALEAELAELRKDKARLDWCDKAARKFHSFPLLSDGTNGAWSASPSGQCLFNDRDALFCYANLRDAIDAAMESK